MRKISVSKVVTIAMTMMILATTYQTGIFASAQDSSYSYNLSKNEGYKTEFRKKENDSSVYMNCKSATKSYKAKVYGGFANSDAHDCSGGYKYLFKSGYKRFMFNFVNEHKYTVAGVFAISGSGTASGLWSPDSVPQSGVKPETDYIKK